MKISKRFKEIHEKVDTKAEYSLKDAIDNLKGISKVGFDESLDCAIRLGVDPRHADQMVRGSVSLPHGTGKEVRVLVLAKAAKAEEALNAGADHAGLEDQIEKINDGWTEFDAVIATPDVMPQVGKLGRVLGPKGLMPNPKSGTVTDDVATAVKEVKAGKIDFRVEKNGIVHTSVGKLSFNTDQLLDNVNEFLRTIMRLRPSSAKGQYVRSIYLSSTMGPGLKITRDEISSRTK
jgi:large subunit ribosomal protein L1